jgi:hypothetical protein
MSNVVMVDRPFSVRFVVVMMYVAALGYVGGVIINITLLMRPEQAQLFFDRPVSDWYWIMSALLDVILVVAFVWIARMAWRGDYSAGMMITLLAALNIAFSLFRLGQVYGWITLALSIAVLAANMAASTQDFYRRSLPRL